MAFSHSESSIDLLLNVVLGDNLSCHWIVPALHFSSPRRTEGCCFLQSNPLFLECSFDRIDLYCAKEDRLPASRGLSGFDRRFEADRFLPQGAFVNLSSLRSYCAFWPSTFISDRFRPTLLEFNARVHYLDSHNVPVQNGRK